MGKTQLLYRGHFYVGMRPLIEFPSIFMYFTVNKTLFT